MSEQFGRLVREARTGLGITQDDLADRTGVSRSTIIRIEGGAASNCESATVRALCAGLDIPPIRAAIALGFLDAADLDVPQHRDPRVQEAIDILDDPGVPSADKDHAIGFLRYLADGRR